MQKRDEWLIISHDFNMDGRAPSLTITDKIPYFLDAGIPIRVISAVTGKKDTRFLHKQLLPWGPSALRFDFRHWFRERFGKKTAYKIITTTLSILLSPFVFLERALIRLSSQSSWSIPAAWYAYRQIKKGNIKLIYTTGGAWSAHYAGYLAHRWTNIPWIAEIHDPLVEEKNKKTKDEKFQMTLEKKIADNAAIVWWFTENALKQAQKRHPSLIKNGYVIRPGAEPPGCHEPLPSQHALSKEHLNILHFGSLADDRSFAPLLEALSHFFEKNPAYRDKIKLHVYGTTLDKTSKAALEKYQLQSIMHEHGRIEGDKNTGKSGRERIMDIMRHADVLLLLHGNRNACHQYIPSKLYDYSWTDRPIFALTHLSVELDELLEKRNAYIAHTMDQDSIVTALETLMQDWKQDTLQKQHYEPVSPKEAVDQILFLCAHQITSTPH